ncbi:unnamed protein product, partial [Mesorhabditis spiculigera]
MVCIIVIAISLEVCVLALFYVVHSYYLLDGRVNMSEKTRRLQKQLLNAMVWQVFVPFATIAGPWGLGAVIVVKRIHTNPLVLQLFVYIDGVHGTLSSHGTLCVLQPAK